MKNNTRKVKTNDGNEIGNFEAPVTLAGMDANTGFDLSAAWCGIAAARNMARTMTAYVLGAVVISALAGILELTTSFYWGTATGATIVLWAFVFFILSLAFRRQ